MKFSVAFLNLLAVAASASEQTPASTSRFLKRNRTSKKGKNDKKNPSTPAPIPATAAPIPATAPIPDIPDPGTPATCSADGKSSFPYMGMDSSERLLLREGVIDEIPASLCGNKDNKNVILVIGDGMGWEMVRAGAIAKSILTELEGMGINTKNGSPGTPEADMAMQAFAGRTLSDYYTSGGGSGLSFQDQLENFALVTTTTTIIGEPSPGNHYAPSTSLLKGDVSDHNDGMAPLLLNECGYPLDFSPLDVLEGGNMVLWNEALGGEFPWDPRYYGAPATGDFDSTYIMQHATDSANTAGTLATGEKASVNMVSVNLYEEKVSTLVEDAMRCGKAGGVVTSVPILHATPAAFVAHSNNRNNADQLKASFREVNPTFASGACGGRLYPSKEMRDDIESGPLSSQWTFLYQGKNDVPAENFYDSVQDLDPDNGEHLLVCFGGEYSVSGEQNMPFRGLDSGYSSRWCSKADSKAVDADGNPTGFIPTSTICDHYPPEDLSEIPKMAENVRAAINFLGKDDDGFFMMYEQGDIDWAAHANHMDDMLGAMLDINDGVQEILDWVQANGGWEKNALYVTADHDHYLTLHDDFPEIVAKHIIMGETRNLTPQNNSNKNPWDAAIKAGRVEDPTKDQIGDIKDFSTWTEEDIANVGHYWGAQGTGGNGWGSHSTRPVGLWYMGDDGCIDALTGKDFQVVGRVVKGAQGKIDQMHLHACMLKSLFGLDKGVAV